MDADDIQREETRKDKARLDWLGKFEVGIDWIECGAYRLDYDPDQSMSFRDYIDKMMSEEQQKEQ